MSVRFVPIRAKGTRSRAQDKFLLAPLLPHKCGVPPGYGTSHLCGSEELCRAPSPVSIIGFPLHFQSDFLLWQLPVPKAMRIRTQVGLFGAGTVACALFLCLSTAIGG